MLLGIVLRRASGKSIQFVRCLKKRWQRRNDRSDMLEVSIFHSIHSPWLQFLTSISLLLRPVREKNERKNKCFISFDQSSEWPNFFNLLPGFHNHSFCTAQNDYRNIRWKVNNGSDLKSLKIKNIKFHSPQKMITEKYSRWFFFIKV